MHYKKVRNSFLRALDRPALYDDIHVIFGGTGAVGGTTAFQLIQLYEELMRYKKPGDEQVPTIIVTGLNKNEIRKFTTRIFQFCEMKYGDHQPVRYKKRGYMTPSGIFIELKHFAVKPEIPALSDLTRKPMKDRIKMIDKFLQDNNLSKKSPVDEKVALLKATIKDKLERPFKEFLDKYVEERQFGDNFKFQSVIVGIPLASVAAYHLTNLEEICRLMGITDTDTVGGIKTLFLEGIRDDLVGIKGVLANEVLIAHTTAVGGMYDETPDGKRIIRIGFAHSASGDRLKQKQIFAEVLSDLYSEGGVDVLVTAAAIGIDGVTARKTVPIKKDIFARLESAVREKSPVVCESDLKSRNLKTYKPVTVDLDEKSSESLFFEHGHDIICDYVIHSGENGFFSIANADALYRIMKVTSASELSVVLSDVAIAGDDPLCPWFKDHISYYTETDNSRMVMDFLYQPQLFNSQLKGLEPQALQDLGSSKHQGELHTLNLLIMLHRLRTLDLDKLEPEIDLERFNPREYFIKNSKRLTFEELIGWDMPALHQDLVTMVRSEEPSDLYAINSLKNRTSPSRNEACHRIMKEVLLAIWAMPSLGSPIIYDYHGKTYVRVGYYIAPLDILMKKKDSISRHLYETFKKSGKNRGHYDKYIRFHITNNGFIDLRSSATIVTARSPDEDLSDKVMFFESEAEFKYALERITPYAYFTTSGLIALMVRLRGLFEYVSRARIELGTLIDFRAQIPRDDKGNILLLPGAVEAFRMSSEGLEKNTGTERISGFWGYCPKVEVRSRKLEVGREGSDSARK